MRLCDPNQFKVTGRSASDCQALAYARYAAGCIGNVTTRMVILDTGVNLMPVSVNDGGEGADNSYVVSPLTAYADYEIRQLERPFLGWFLQQLVRAVSGQLESAHIDRIVQVNNWLLSTNLYPPEWDGAGLPEITRLLVEAYPDHAIGFRSLNRYSNSAIIDQLQAIGYLLIPSRQVYLFDGNNGSDSAYLRRNNYLNDARLLARTRYSKVPGEALTDLDFQRIEHLYNLLYLDKYCPLNPRFSTSWLRAGQRDGWLSLTALRSDEGNIDAVLGWFSNERVITTPVVGYDTALGQELGLYRMISQITLEETARRRCLLNLSSGAAHFKRLRGGQPEIEYNLVYVGHLPATQQRIWYALGRLLNSIGVPVMRKLKL